jgi:SNF2 family DNA or RNA helicase
MLDLIQILLKYEKMKYLRIDGKIKNPKERQNIIDSFNKNNEYFCLLLSTGGKKFNLIIIFI